MSGEAHESGGGEAAGALPVRGRIDRLGRLVDADRRLADLNGDAGGAPGGALVVPQLADLAALARQLGVAVSRPISAATDRHDLRLAARAWPEGDEVVVAIDEWHEVATHEPQPAEDAARRHDVLRAVADWSWETDDALRLTGFAGVPGGEPNFVGGSLTALLQLLPDDNGALPILDALGGHRAFAGQRAQGIRDGKDYVLAAEPLFDGKGRFRGFRGVAETLDADTQDTPRADGFGQRLDQALRSSLGRVVEGAETIRAQAHGALRRDYSDYAGDIALAGRHLIGLIDDLVDLEAVDRGDFSIDIGTVDLAAVARRSIGLLAATAKVRNIRIDGPDVAEQLLVAGDDRRVLQIVVNLLGNAVRYAPEHSEVWIRVSGTAELASLVVADQGRGIAAADHGRIFDKFDRLGADEPGGSGLGLYIARRLARMMAGDIAVDSAPGQGARFTLTLPAVR